jgi:hypothetical protein
MFDDETTWLADSLRVAIEQLQAMTIQADRQSARIVSLIAELRTARAEAQALGAQVRYLQNIAA